MDFSDRVDAILESYVLCENSTYSISGGIFSDLKKIYLAHADGREPDKMTLNRASEVMVRFLTSEIERTEEWLTPEWLASYVANPIGTIEPPTPEAIASWRSSIREMIDKYIVVRDGLDKAWQTADYRKMWVYIDHSINLHHWYGSVWDNLGLAATYNNETQMYDRDPDAKKLQDELSRFLESIGRFPREMKKGESWDDVMKQTWQFGPDGERVPYEN